MDLRLGGVGDADLDALSRDRTGCALTGDWGARAFSWGVGCALAACTCAVAFATYLGGTSDKAASSAHAVSSASLARETSGSSRLSRSSNVSIPAEARRAVWGGTYDVGTHRVQIEFSDAYAPDEAAAQKWADFLSGLPHGEEVGTLSLRFVPPAEIAAHCSATAAACYFPSRNLIVTSPEPAADGTAPEDLLRHEYGHHVANHRLNPPWRAIVMGPKRWASRMEVCSRAKRGELSLQDQGAGYQLNPGEGFAEAFRVLAESRAGDPTTTWPIVDRLFFPSGEALAAVVEDVEAPWVAPIHASTRGRFAALRATSTRSFSLPTPRDGSLVVRVRAADAVLRVVVRSATGEVLVQVHCVGRSEAGGSRDLWSAKRAHRCDTSWWESRAVRPGYLDAVTSTTKWGDMRSLVHRLVALAAAVGSSLWL